MFIFFTIVLIAIGLSMDTFSMSLSYGMFLNNKKEIIKISIVVGIFHFFMPYLGMLLGTNITRLLLINDFRLIGILLMIITIEIAISLIKKDEFEPLNSYKEILLYAFTVSLDSFTTGIGLNLFNQNIFLITMTFFIFSFLSTYVGLSLGNKIKEKYGLIAKFIGLLILLLLSLYYLIKWNNNKILWNNKDIW